MDGGRVAAERTEAQAQKLSVGLGREAGAAVARLQALLQSWAESSRVSIGSSTLSSTSYNFISHDISPPILVLGLSLRTRGCP